MVLCEFFQIFLSSFCHCPWLQTDGRIVVMLISMENRRNAIVSNNIGHICTKYSSDIRHLVQLGRSILLHFKITKPNLSSIYYDMLIHLSKKFGKKMAKLSGSESYEIRLITLCQK